MSSGRFEFGARPKQRDGPKRVISMENAGGDQPVSTPRRKADSVVIPPESPVSDADIADKVAELSRKLSELEKTQRTLSMEENNALIVVARPVPADDQEIDVDVFLKQVR